MTAKEYLLRYQIAYREALDADNRAQEFRLKYALPSAIQYSDMPTAHNSNRDLSDYIAQYERMVDIQIAKRMKCMGIEADILVRLDRMEKQEERELLRYRYVDGLNWQQIANRMGYGLRHVYKIHGSALQHFPVPY